MTVSDSHSSGLDVAPVTLPTLALVAAVFFVGSWAGIAATYFTGRIAAIWIGNAVAIAAALKTRRKDRPTVLAVAFAANVAADLTVGDPLFRAAVFSLANAAEITVVVMAVCLLKLDRDLLRPKTLLTFYAVALGPAPVVSALIAGIYSQLVAGTPFWGTVHEWYVSDALDLIILVPPLVTTQWRDFVALFGKAERPVTILLLTLLVAVIVVNLVASNYPLVFLFFPIVLLLTFLRGFAGGAIGLITSITYLLTLTLFGPGAPSMHGQTIRDQIMVAQIFGAVLSFTVVLVGATLEERRQLELRMVYAMSEADAARGEAVDARDAAEAANRTKSMFLANMSHELRTPLNAVIGFSELMHSELYGPLGDAKYREYAQLVHDAGAHLLDLINDVLDMSKIEAGGFEIDRQRLDPCQVVTECITLVSGRAADAGVALSADLPASPTMVDADRRALKQILLNLLSNAVKFTPAGGSVRVWATIEPDRFLLGVEDTGVGIPAQEVARLGQPFVQLRDSANLTHKGTGLGLALVRSLAELHGGAMRVTSQKGVGTTVTVEIPFAIEARESPQDIRAA